ncbi:guanylate-binding protein 6-like [Ruditapes philippinarum]|uniref:guanylate-binding protein 6-like n=1 Tax=Ruditapes philippinarum TaxID=129788 RepID=UPI00295C05AE|nr:guanylate-binding protein 6-like [Ruditapes philippinarum]
MGFPLGNTTDATTKGLWVWCLEHPERKDEVLMLIDTEGIGDVKKGDEKNDNDILCLAILISGTFVYNCIGVINHDLLKKLSHTPTTSAGHSEDTKPAFGEDTVAAKEEEGTQ